MRNGKKHFSFLALLGCGLATGTIYAQTAPPTANTTAAPATDAAIKPVGRLLTQATPGAAALPAGAERLVSGYEQQAQEGLILAYFAAGTLGDALTAGSISSIDGRHQAESYLALASSARDDLKGVRNAYTLAPEQLEQLDRMAAAYGDVIPMIEADRQMADAPGDAANKTAFQTARRKAFATLAALFDWK